MAAPVELYDSFLWRCGRNDENPSGNERVFSLTLNPFNLSVPLLTSAWQGQVSADIVHHHGCWSLTSMAALILKKRYGLPLIYSPHGAFIPASLERYPLAKDAYLRVWERRVLQAVDCFHAVSGAEAESISLMAGCRPIAVIPNGIDLERTPLRDILPGFWRRWDIPDGSFKILFLSRVVADKGVDLLLRAMAQVLHHVPHAHCIVAGDGPQGYRSQLTKIVRETGLTKSVTFTGPLEGEEKFLAYRNADVFVLPSRNEAQGIVVLEALSQNLPVVASRCTPYAELDKAGCGWWEDNSPEALAAALARAAALGPQALRTMGENGRKLLSTHYSLAKVHAELSELYAWVAGGMRSTDQPPFIV
jgi:glycosyltransferase involved in cell wall biosynthesis